MAPLFKLIVALNRTSPYSRSTISANKRLLVSLYVAAAGTFITAPCTKDADCASSCCGFNSGKCAGPVIAQERDGGCGFGDAQPNDIAAQAITGGSSNVAAAAVSAPAAAASIASTSSTTSATGSGKALGTQFITGTCASDAECASGCCALNTGKCAARLVAQEGAGCGFGGGATASTASVQAAAAPAAAAASPPASAASSAPAPGSTLPAIPGTQFITGICTKDADCASSCCGFNSGKCAGPVIAQTRDGGCGFGDAQPNDIAAQAFQGRKLGRRGPSFM